MTERSPVRVILRPLLTGFFALLPVGRTAAILAWLIEFLARLFGQHNTVGAVLMEPRDNPYMRTMQPIAYNFGGTSLPAFLPTSQTFSLQMEGYHVVIIPTAPVPFGGAILCVPRDSVTPLDCGIDGLFNIYMSMGTMVTDYLSKAPPPDRTQ